jgi:hypothetical protein
MLLCGLCLTAALSLAEEAPLCQVVVPEFRSMATPAPVQGVKRVLWYRLAFDGDTRAPASAAEAEAAMQVANATLQRISYGKVSVTWTISPLIQLPRSAAFYSANLAALLSDAQAGAAAIGLRSADFDRDLLAPPPVPTWMPGLAGIGGRWLYVSMPNGGLVVHELGHTFGLPHANSWVTGRPDPFQKTFPPFPSDLNAVTGSLAFETNSFVGRTGVMFPGVSHEYGDVFDIMAMSNASADFNVDFKERLGWIAGSQITNVNTSGVVRIYSMAAATLQAGRTYAIRIAKPIVGRTQDGVPRFYSIEVNPSGNGVVLRWSGGSGPSLLIHSAANFSANFLDAGLTIGRAFDDPGLGLSIVTKATGGSGPDAWVDVAIDFAAGAKEADNPPLPWSLPDFIPTYTVRGKVIDARGVPIPACRVHSGRINSYAGDRSDFTSTQTDRQGNYALIVPGTGAYTVGASAYGYKMAVGITEQSINVTEAGVTNLNFKLEALPRVSVSAPSQINEGQPCVFTISRSGPTNEAVTVSWLTTGSADASDFASAIGGGEVIIPAGATSTTLTFPTVNDEVAEGPETITVQVTAPSFFERNGTIFSYPGWELHGPGSEQKWVQTDPMFATFADGSATTTIIDPTQPGVIRLAVSLDKTGNASLQVFGAANQTVSIESSADLKTWQPVASKTLTSPSTQISAPATGGRVSFYRARVL